MAKKKKGTAPILVRNPTFVVTFDDVDVIFRTREILRAVDFFQSGCKVKMEAEILEGTQLDSTPKLITTKKIIEFTVMFRSGKWKVRTAEHVYHITSW
ncbi:MAG: hypothetical protein IKG56_01605 [Clostridia bacterium]|nr:hypothetical protein [Clostridia bacterium]